MLECKWCIYFQPADQYNWNGRCGLLGRDREVNPSGEACASFANAIGGFPFTSGIGGSV